MPFRFVLLAGWLLFAVSVQAATFTVDDESDGLANAGDCADMVGANCSLRDALAAANTSPNGVALDEIHFNISVGAAVVAEIALTAPLVVSDPVIIDGFTQPLSHANRLNLGDDALPLVRLKGNAANVPNNHGIEVTADGCTIKGLIFTDFAVALLVDDRDGTRISGNHIGSFGGGGNGVGVDVTGSDNIIGGTTIADRNVISGNTNGIVFGTGAGNAAKSNFIGVAPAVTQGQPNSSHGVVVQNGTGVQIGGLTLAEVNVISGNGGSGVRIEGGTGVRVQGNRIGSAFNSTVFANSGAGVHVVGGSKHIIGGTASGESNIIANNAGGGVKVDVVTPVYISGNRLFDNVGLGIDVSTTLPAPTLTLARVESDVSKLSGNVAGLTTGETYEVQLFVSDVCDGSGMGEGTTYLFSASGTAAGGALTFNQNLVNLLIPAGKVITATTSLTDVVNGSTTSEFSACYTVESRGKVDLSATAYTIGEADGSLVVTVTRAEGTLGAVSVDVITSDISALAGTDYTALSETVSFADGESGDKTVSIPILDDDQPRADRAFTVTLGNRTGQVSFGARQSATVTIVDDERCGNGTLDNNETCDDDNQTDGDGCSHLCIVEVCGDGVVNNGTSEQCDVIGCATGLLCNANCLCEGAPSTGGNNGGGSGGEGESSDKPSGETSEQEKKLAASGGCACGSSTGGEASMLGLLFLGLRACLRRRDRNSI